MTPQPQPTERAQREALNVLNAAGVRMFYQGGVFKVGIWSDLDSKEMRTALAILGFYETPVVYLEGPDIPMRLKVRRTPIKTPAMSWDEWKAQALNRLLHRGKITEKTVRRGRLSQIDSPIRRRF